MPSSFEDFVDGDVIEAEHVSEMHLPIQNLERGKSFYAVDDGSTATAYAVVMDPAPDNPHPSGMIVNFKVSVENLAGSPDVMLEVNGMGSKPLIKEGGISLAAGDLKEDQIVSVIYDDSVDKFHLLSTNTASNLDASIITTGVLNPERLGSGASAEAVLCGDGVFRQRMTGFLGAASWQGQSASDAVVVCPGTSEESDTSAAYLWGAPVITDARAAGVQAFGVDHPTAPGRLSLHSAIGADIYLQPGGGGNLRFVGTGGSGHFLRQNSYGGAVSGGPITSSDLSSSALRPFQSQQGGASLCLAPLKDQRDGENPFLLGSGSVTLGSKVNAGGIPGGVVWPVSGTGSQPSRITVRNCLIPVTARRSYFGRIWLENYPGSQSSYAGCICFDADGGVLGGGAYTYFICSNVTAPNTGQWYSGIIGYESFPTGTAYITPMFLTGYGSPSGAWTTYATVPEIFEMTQCTMHSWAVGSSQTLAANTETTVQWSVVGDLKGWTYSSGVYTCTAPGRYLVDAIWSGNVSSVGYLHIQIDSTYFAVSPSKPSDEGLTCRVPVAAVVGTTLHVTVNPGSSSSGTSLSAGKVGLMLQRLEDI